jgi:hypothetical protein
MSKPTYQQVHIDVALTNISIAYRNGKFIAENIFPLVPVEKISDKYFIYTKADWFRREAAPRAPGTRAARGDYGLSLGGPYVCTERAIGKGVPDEIADNADSPLDMMRDATEWTTEQLLLEQEYSVASKAFGAGWSASATPSVLWSNPTSTPIEDTETAVNTIAGAIGNEPNTGVMGRGLWRYVKQHPDIVDRIKYSAGPNSPAVVTINAVAALFSLDKLLIGTAVQETGAEGATSSMSYIWGNHMLVAYVVPRASLLQPSAGYLLAYKTRRVERFREEQEHQYVITTSQSWDVIQPAADAAYLVKSAA